MFRTMRAIPLVYLQAKSGVVWRNAQRPRNPVLHNVGIHLDVTVEWDSIWKVSPAVSILQY